MYIVIVNVHTANRLENSKIHWNTLLCFDLIIIANIIILTKLARFACSRYASCEHFVSTLGPSAQ